MISKIFLRSDARVDEGGTHGMNPGGLRDLIAHIWHGMWNYGQL